MQYNTKFTNNVHVYNNIYYYIISQYMNTKKKSVILPFIIYVYIYIYIYII